MPLLAQTWPFPWPEDRIAGYTARRASSPIVVDGRLDEADWRAAERSPRFADLIGGTPWHPRHARRVLWDDTYLYVGYWVEEPFVEATLTERDAPIYKNNDVELFIAGRDAYYEFEINAFGTIYEVFFIWERAFESSGYARRPEFDRTREGVQAVPWRRLQASIRAARASATGTGTCRAWRRRSTWTGRSTTTRIVIAVGPWNCASRGVRSSRWRCRTAARCRRGTATSGAWISRGSTSTRKPRRRRIPAAGPGVRTACGIRTSRSCSRACASRPNPWP